MERVIVAALMVGEDAQRSLDELHALVETAGGEVIACVTQSLQHPEIRTLIGSGKVRELALLAENSEAELVVFDNELSPAQTKNLEDELNVRVIDRSTLILDIFASRAKSREGKLQVELAQCKYILPRLTGRGIEMSRLGGGIGTRGPGETKLETDRRHIRRHIAKIVEELADVSRVREQQRHGRERAEFPTVGIIGYTNAGKSTLLNTLTGSEISAQNRLFDTLDTTTRKCAISDTLEIVLTDTVGFISRLPTHLINAFKSTLEELKFVDVLIHVVDASDDMWRENAAVVDKITTELNVGDKPVIIAFNKIDLCADLHSLPSGDMTVGISAKSGLGIDALKEKLCRVLTKTRRRVELRLPFERADIVDLLHRQAQVISLEYEPDGIRISAICEQAIFGKVSEFIDG